MAEFIGLSIVPHNDISIDASGNLVFVTDSEAIAQHIRQRLMTWKGEWFLNTDAGIDWTRYILGRAPSERAIAEAVIKREILQTPGVVEILAWDAEYDASSRGLRITRCVVSTVFDEQIDIPL
jgi:hypothetical protein